jgi:Glycosyl transferase family 2
MSAPHDAAMLATEPASVMSRADAAGNSESSLEVAVVICAYTEERWEQTVAAVRSVTEQCPRPAQVMLIVDHSASLAARARRELSAITVLESDDQPGLSGARNTGLRASRFGITAFLDDDAAARPGWLASLVEPYSDPDVVATAGSVHPLWLAAKPRWLPPEFYWVVGCSYRGLPQATDTVRNPIGANMSIRTADALSAGGFRSVVGRAGGKLQACEETELAIRLSASQSGSVVVYTPAAAADHNVGPERAKFSYFLRRCWHEGWSKATVVALVGVGPGLKTERKHVLSVMPTGVLRELRQSAGGDPSALMRGCAMAVGFMTTACGFLAGSARPANILRRRTARRPS